jgi:MFS family permease
MLAAERGRGVAASIFGGASVLCWQPGLAFLFGAWAALLGRRPEYRRISRIAGLALASLVPAALLLGWLHANGALSDFWEQAVLFNLHYIEDKARTPLGTLRALARSFGDWNDVELLLAPAAAAGLWSLRARGPLGLPRSVLVSGAIYGAMTFVSYQSWPDAILLGPLVATLLGAGLFGLFRWRLAPHAAAVAAATVMVLAAVPDTRPKFHPPIDFDTQRARFRALADGIAPDARVIGVSVPEFFLHTGRRNGWKWPYLWFGVDDFAARQYEGGFEGMLADLEKDAPELILIARLWAGPQRARFEEWAAARYDVRAMRLFPHTRRSLRVYRLREGAGAAQ